MRKLIMFLAGLMLIVLTFAALCVAGAIYDTGGRHTIDTFFFQTNGRSAMRLGVPARASDLGDSKMRDMLIAKYVYEYFYVVPDTENVNIRTRGTSTLARMSSGAVFREWLDTVAANIRALAADGAMRTVRITDEITKDADDDYWAVPYELKTWYTPNDLNSTPELEYGIMYVNLAPGTMPTAVRESVNLGPELENGRDPATIFKFRVNRVEIQ